ncbi:Mo-dependent nitrogenase-like protein [Planktothrix sp. PCC 11201]|uniref:Mo-dependent nitrogenase C-terminal domain-containing protein n=1 Tax=Planktothrix sp. PCC 11201 TaxID=1729650 RepID=UPI0009121B44|nr:Mo-dependent nitrogenase C-terminal domain-containing protein [Planktothrix sp. PCC 11201]SKB11963.1 Mo-dependent nitrogenase-like protein [Planktothrix sp. PCC 11201]
MLNLISPLLNPLRQWLDNLDIHNPDLALFLYRVIPAQCPFARNIKLFGHTIVHIPPLCKFNPLYEQLMGLRFRAMCYLVDDCGMTI